MGLFQKKDELPDSALRFLSAALPAADDKKPASPRPGHLPVLDKAGAKAILKDIDWDAPEAKDFLAAAAIAASDLDSFKIGDKPDILVGAFKDPLRLELFERLLFCSCCCGSCRICKWYPFCRRRCGRVLFELKDGSSYWAHRVRVIGADVEKDAAHPGGVKITIAASGGGVSIADFNTHKTGGDHDARYAPKDHDGNHDAHNDGRYALIDHDGDHDAHNNGLFALKDHDEDHDTHNDGLYAPKSGLLVGNINRLAINPTSVSDGGSPAVYQIKIPIDFPIGFIQGDPIPGTTMNDWVCAHFTPTAGGVGTAMIVENAAIVDGSSETPPTGWYISFNLYYMNGATRVDYNSAYTAFWSSKSLIVTVTIPITKA